MRADLPTKTEEPSLCSSPGEPRGTPSTKMTRNAQGMAIWTALKSLQRAALFRGELTVRDDVIELGSLQAVRIME